METGVIILAVAAAFFAAMVQLLATIKGDNVYVIFCRH
jgi:hypothetical protein